MTPEGKRAPVGAEEKVNILLVDDQPGKLLGYEVILSELGENLIKAGSANEALEQLLKKDVAVVLIDVCMPDLDGFELAAMIREHPRYQKTAIIFVSAIQVTDLDLLRGYAAGAVDYVPVPVIPDLLRAKVRVFAELYRKSRQLEVLNAELERRVAERTAELAHANADLVRRALGPGIQITTEFEADVPPTRVDPNQLELALLNLALNARDAMPLGGQLTISAHRERVAPGTVPGLAPGDYVRIAERDNGEGMDEATLKRATEPFFTTKGAGRGTGLGLSVVDGLVAQSGGAMRITSRPAAGTTVELWLPVSPAEAAAERVRPAAPMRFANTRCCRVLVVDDDPIVLAGTAAMLEDLGHLGTEAESADSALRALLSGANFELVITDHAMPGMTGTELAARIRCSWPELPVVIATGYAELPGDGDPAFPRLSKPYRQQELAALVARLVGEVPVVVRAPLNAAAG